MRFSMSGRVSAAVLIAYILGPVVYVFIIRSNSGAELQAADLIFRLQHLFHGPVLAAGFLLAHRLMRRSSIERISSGLNRIMLLILSYSLILLLDGRIADALFLAPSVLFLFNMRESVRDYLIVGEKRLIFRGEDISSRFSQFQLYLLNCFIDADDGRISCRELSGPLSNECCGSECKASLCRSYDQIYRNVIKIRKVLRQLQIAEIRTPENKRDITAEGWRLLPFSGVKIIRRSMGSSAVFRAARPAARGAAAGLRPPEKSGGINLSVKATAVLFYAVLNYAAVLIDFQRLSLSPIFFISFVIFYSLAIIFMPAARTDRSIVPVSVAVLLSICLPLLSAAPESEVLIFFLLIKMSIVYLSLLMFCRSFPVRSFSGYENNSRRLFWVVWFYMASILVFRENVSQIFSSYAPETELGLRFLFFHDRLVLLVVIVQSVFKITSPAEVLCFRDGRLYLNGFETGAELTESNRKLLRYMLRSSSPAYCDGINKLLYEDEASVCGEGCKPSICPSYQKIYKRIRIIRDFLETEKLGTVLSPARTPGSAFSGWRLLLYENVYFQD